MRWVIMCLELMFLDQQLCSKDEVVVNVLGTTALFRERMGWGVMGLGQQLCSEDEVMVNVL